MNLKTIKVSEKGYMELNSYAGSLRVKENRPVSLNEALLKLLEKSGGTDISRFAGGWKMSDEEFEKIQKDIKKLWKSWKIGL